MSIHTAAVLGLVLATSGASARAATITTDAFVAVVEPTITFLDAAGRLAAIRADSPRVRAFARVEVASQDQAAERLDTWRGVEAKAVVHDESGPTLDRLGPIAGLLKLPYDAVADATSSASPPLTGLPSAARLRDAFRRDMERLATLRGGAFTELYAPTQIAGLERLETAYKSFILNGDNPIMRRLAVDGLPKVEHLLARAKKL